MIGPRLKRDREKAVPNNLMFVAVGAGILWLGWNGFNGGDPYFAGRGRLGAADRQHQRGHRHGRDDDLDPAWTCSSSSEKKPTFLGGLNGMICGLVGITPAAGFVNGLGAIIIGFVPCSAIVWVAWYTTCRSYVWPFNKVDDALGVVYTHGIAACSAV